MLLEWQQLLATGSLLCSDFIGCIPQATIRALSMRNIVSLAVSLTWIISNAMPWKLVSWTLPAWGSVIVVMLGIKMAWLFQSSDCGLKRWLSCVSTSSTHTFQDKIAFNDADLSGAPSQAMSLNPSCCPACFWQSTAGSEHMTTDLHAWSDAEQNPQLQRDK